MFLQWIKDYAALLSVCAVAVGWFATRRGQIHGDRAKHSHAYSGILEKPEYLSSLRIVGPLLDRKEVYDETRYEKEERDKISGAIWDCLQALERAAIDIDMGYVSEEYFYKKYKTLTERIFVTSHLLINKTRKEKGSSTLYKNLEAMYIRIHYSKRPFILSVLEYLKVCPDFKKSASIFSSHLLTKDKSLISFLVEMVTYRRLPTDIDYINNDAHDLYNKRIWILSFIELGIVAFFLAFLFFGPYHF
ncbi:hypothetical protein [Mesorhizobium sp. M0847]|uniref:DUF4760 domain-containing protein n=1 Tax=unclassified Mesorhizobium TaxID=325217 RepID=UPI0033381E95